MEGLGAAFGLGDLLRNRVNAVLENPRSRRAMQAGNTLPGHSRLLGWLTFTRDISMVAMY
jgi:hypothetical protein